MDSLIVGTLLGDAYIDKHTNIPNSYTFRFSQANKEFALWKAGQIQMPFYYYERNRYDRRTDKTYYSCDVIIKMDKERKKYWYNLFYTPTKTVTIEVLNKLDEKGIALWYLDDGSMYYNGNNCHLNLAVDGFKFEERNLILKWFKENFGLNFKHSQNAIRLTSKKETERFMDIVEKYIPNCMEYKTLTVAMSKYDKTLTDEQRKYRNNKYKQK